MEVNLERVKISVSSTGGGYEYGKLRIMHEIAAWVFQAFPFYRKS